ncbi:hypothetical protein FNU76_20160 [Chitinimonas arctica]|uniref:Uncharacterized protein n=1 Tax=Chitinimonas arctica TaxID=2594795 RepID=A0A516SK01_9NEIS|nr:hypothetical protein [Chitinimonas arctica]QDQ28485.1 hypothetical protein FNU76_20160 [Chitinimonas arctica]
MKQVKLVWASNSAEWEDVSCKADRVSIADQIVRVEYSGATDDEGRYQGVVELELREGMQTVEGEYTVLPAKTASEQFAQVVGFGLTGQIKPLEEGGYYFSGIWDEGGIAQAFQIFPLPMSAASDEARQASSFKVDELAIRSVPNALQDHVKALRRFERAMQPYRGLLDGVAAFAEFGVLFGAFDQVLNAAKTRMDRHLADDLDGEALLEYLRDEASLALEALLDQGTGLRVPQACLAETAEFVRDMEGLAKNLHDAILREGYELCRVWLGMVPE